jgi:SAM-dependent methyltransferase
MNQFLHGLTRAACETWNLPGPVVEIGSYQVAGQEDLINLRSFFPRQIYHGLDVRAGPGVDCVADVEALPFADDAVGTVLALNTFEHVKHFWKGFDEIARVLKPHGAFLVACPFFFHIHNYPNDYWRFTPASLEVLLDPFPHRVLGWNGTDKRPNGVWAVAFKNEAPKITPNHFHQFQINLNHWAKQPMAWTKKWRYRLGSWLFGKRPFAPYLERDQFKCCVQQK